jgi:hypothetical protein
MRQALTGNLLFTRQEATRIKARARFLASLPPSADPVFPPPSKEHKPPSRSGDGLILRVTSSGVLLTIHLLLVASNQ